MADRDAKGRLLPGHSGGGARAGAGRPRGSRKELLAKAISDDDWTRIYRAMYDAAVGGDVRAATFLDERYYGKVQVAEEDVAADVPAITVTFHQPPVLPQVLLPIEPDQSPE